ncbi:MarR family winged helix-turn-helix transcriptional regulator [Amycolatopsis lurida]
MRSHDDLEDALVRVSFRVMAVLTRIGSAHDLSLTQLRLLGLLRDRRPRMSDLAVFLGLDKSTMTGLVERAERRGLVVRGKSPEDGRAVAVFITPPGSDLVDRLQEEIRAELAPFTGRLREDDRDLLTNLLDTLSGRTGDEEPTNAL